MTGVWPPEYVDHIDGNPRNNTWSNLRLASAQQNARNKKRKYGSASGIKGVKFDSRSNTWHVQMMVDGVVRSAGPFYSYHAACQEYDRRAAEAFGEFHRTEAPRAQRALFKQEDVSQALEAYIAGTDGSKIPSHD